MTRKAHNDDFFAKAQIGRWAVHGLREPAQRAGRAHDFLRSGGERGRVEGNWVEMSSPPFLASCDSVIANPARGASQKIYGRRGGLFPVNRGCAGVTLIELLVVMVIIGLLAAISLPALKGFGQSNIMAAANRQLLDDLAYARAAALNNRTDVFFVFATPSAVIAPQMQSLDTHQQRLAATNLLAGIHRSYGIYAKRRAGEQPGRQNHWYLLDWRTLPEGVIFGNDLQVKNFPAQAGFDPALQQLPPFISGIRLPTEDSPVNNLSVQGFAFNPRGQVTDGTNILNMEIIIPMVRASVFPSRDGSGNYTFEEPDLQETPPNNGINNYNVVVVDHITGRARTVRPEIE